jgi:hypothetical protein
MTVKSGRCVKPDEKVRRNMRSTFSGFSFRKYQVKTSVMTARIAFGPMDEA